MISNYSIELNYFEDGTYFIYVSIIRHDILFAYSSYNCRLDMFPLTEFSKMGFVPVYFACNDNRR